MSFTSYANVLSLLAVLCCSPACNIKPATNAENIVCDEPVIQNEELLHHLSSIATALANNDRATFADMVQYPIRAGVNGKQYIIETPEQFAANYENIINPEFKQKILESIDDVLRIHDRFAIGPGLLWLDLEHKIVTLNNDAVGYPEYLDAQGRVVIAPESRKNYRVFINRLVNDPGAGYEMNDFFYLRDLGLYKADINNDQADEFIIVGEWGSARHSQIIGVWQDQDGKLIRLPIKQVASKSLYNNTYFEWKYIMTRIANPFLVLKDGIVHFGFDDYEYYVWQGDRISRMAPTEIHSGANPNMGRSDDYAIIRQKAFDFLKTLKQDDPVVLAGFIQYPFMLPYPVPPIRNREEFVKRIDEVFDDVTRERLLTADIETDFAQMGWGVMFDLGFAWFSDEMLLKHINHQTAVLQAKRDRLIREMRDGLHASLREFRFPVLQKETFSYRFRIDEMHDNTFRLAIWPRNGRDLDQPNTIIGGGTVEFAGSGPNHWYRFKNAGLSYEVAVTPLRTTDTPPGELNIFRGEECIESEPFRE